jgi:uncharacterized spore protein YtfJ
MAASDVPEATPAAAEAKTDATPPPSGMGGGGGGGSGGRPVAIIDIGPDGVSIKPIMDITKVALALAGAMASMLPLLLRARRAAARQKREE